MNNIKWLSALAFVAATLVGPQAFAVTHRFHASPKFDTTFDARYRTLFCKDDRNIPVRKGQTVTNDVGGCAIWSVSAKVYDPACFLNVEPLEGREKDEAIEKHRVEMDRYRAEVARLAAIGAPQDPRTGEYYITPPPTTTGPGAAPTTQPVHQTLKMPVLLLTRNYCHAERYDPNLEIVTSDFYPMETFPGSATEMPRYKVVKH